MTEDINFQAAADIQAAIEAAGGTVREFEQKEVQRQQGALMAAMSSLMGGRTEQRYVFDVAIPGPTTQDIDVDPATVDGEDAVQAVAVAATWADDEGLDALAADLAELYQRLGDQVLGDGHPADEQEAFQMGDGDD